MLENAMQCWKNKSYRIKATLIASAIGFGSMHMLNLTNGDADLISVAFQAVYASALGFFFAAIYMRTRNLWGMILVHGLIDASSFFFSGSDNLGLDAVSIIAVVAIVVIFGGIGCYLVRKSKINEIEELWVDEEDTVVRSKKMEKVAKMIACAVGVISVAGVVTIIGIQVFANKKGMESASNFDFTKFEMTSFEDNSTMTESDLKNSKITVVNIWETSCTACIEEMPALEAVSKKYEGDVQIVGLCADTTTDGKANETKIDEAKKIVEKTKVTYPQLMPSSEISKSIDEIYAYPLTIILDQDGKILDSITGGKDQKQWDSIIKDYL